MEIFTQKTGKWGENVAAQYLRERGYRIVGQNVKLAVGEIDLVARYGAELVIVEVKTRSSHRYGYPEGAVTPSKQHKLRMLAELYWRTHRQYRRIRIDVIAISIDSGGGCHVHHIEHAV